MCLLASMGIEIPLGCFSFPPFRAPAKKKSARRPPIRVLPRWHFGDPRRGPSSLPYQRESATRALFVEERKTARMCTAVSGCARGDEGCGGGERGEVGFGNPDSHSVSRGKPMFLRMEQPSGRIRFCSCPLSQSPQGSENPCRGPKIQCCAQTWAATAGKQPDAES
jgi:hypothetical protein